MSRPTAGSATGSPPPSYVRDVSLPALERGAARAGRNPMDIEVSMPVFIVTGETEEEMASSAQAARQQLAFYGSTPAYRPGAGAPRLGRRPR